MIWKGTWVRESDTRVTVRKRVVSTEMTVPLTKEPVPGAQVEEPWQLRGMSNGRLAATLKTSVSEYEPLLAISDIDTLSRIINASPEAPR